MPGPPGVLGTESGAHTTVWKHQLPAGASGGGLSVGGERGRGLCTRVSLGVHVSAFTERTFDLFKNSKQLRERQSWNRDMGENPQACRDVWDVGDPRGWVPSRQ